VFRRFHHGHAAGLGFLLALAMERHTLTLVLLGVVAGLVAGRAWATWATMAGALREKLLRVKRERIASRPTPVYKASAQDRDGIGF
jgi:hypothetical protein